MKARRGMILAVILLLSLIIAPCAFAEQYDDDAITVYITISDDGEFVEGTDGTVMARVPVKLSYFDLADYGLSEYYRYEAAPFSEGGAYISNRIIKEPTLLHLYIKVLEKYCAGRELTPEDMHSDIINVTGSPTHVFLDKFWRHNFNLMYFVDHEYPLQSKGWGSTCDYIILYDGSEIDVAMFTDMEFHTTGAFTRFDSTREQIQKGESVTLALLGTETKDGGGEVDTPLKNEPIRVSSDFGRTWDTEAGSTDASGEVTLSFDKEGVYLVSAGPKMVNYPSVSGMPDTAPPISVIVVGDVDEDAARERAAAVMLAERFLGSSDVTGAVENKEQYTGETYQAFAQAKEALEVLIGDKSSSAQQIKDAVALAEQAVASLEIKAPAPPAKRANTLKVTLRKKLWTFKAATLKKRKKIFKAVTVTGAKGKLTYTVTGTAKAKRALTFNKKTGKVTVRKGTKKGLYKLNVKVSAAGNATFLKKTQTVTVKVRVK